MSFDLKIFRGDLLITSGDLTKVIDTEKLAQDVLKVLVTQVGSNPFFPWYGSLISGELIGDVIDFQFIESNAEQQVESALNTIKQLQNAQQNSSQRVTAAEMLAAVRNINISRDTIDPTIFSVDVTVVSRALKQVSVDFQIL